MSLTEFLVENNFVDYEGHCQQVPDQVTDLIALTQAPNLSVLEIGFSAGHSAEVFLKNNSTLTVTSFDLGTNPYVLKGKEHIDAVYPGRHTLILGDSNVTIPEFIASNSKKFDVIFIDGSVDYYVVKADLENCLKLATANSIVILDDVVLTSSAEDTAYWNPGPTQLWKEVVQDNNVVQTDAKFYQYGRGMAWGKYNLANTTFRLAVKAVAPEPVVETVPQPVEETLPVPPSQEAIVPPVEPPAVPVDTSVEEPAV
jgi:predicted O-methyltransferase YrrM